MYSGKSFWTTSLDGLVEIKWQIHDQFQQFTWEAEILNLKMKIQVLDPPFLHKNIPFYSNYVKYILHMKIQYIIKFSWQGGLSELVTLEIY